jgi:FAD/FMN-containing dehydrogenase
MVCEDRRRAAADPLASRAAAETDPARVVTETRRAFLARGARLGVALALAPALRVPAARAADPRLEDLTRAVRGRVLTPASPAYDEARRVVNSRFDAIRPLAVVRPVDAHDVEAVVRWAAHTGVPIVARSGGHSFGGYSTTTGVVVDLSRLADVTVASPGHATVGAGARLGTIAAKLGAHGVAIPAGSCPSVGIGGLALGGGFGFSSRSWGLTCDSVERIEIVTADGRLRTCDAGRHPDLLWACRGGGGSFGIVTRFVFRTHRVGGGSWFVARFPWSHVEQVVARFLAWAPAAPDALGAACRLAGGATAPTVEVFGQHLGPERALRRELPQLTEGLRPSSLHTGSASWLGLVALFGSCGSRPLAACTQPRRLRFVAASDYVDRPLSPHAITALRHTIEQRSSASVAVQLDAYGGAVNRVAPAATAFVHRRTRASCQYFATGEVGSAAAWLRAARAAMAPHVSGFAYQNYADPGLEQWQHAYYGANLPRLRRVKRRYDPHDLFRVGQSIRPA